MYMQSRQDEHEETVISADSDEEVTIEDTEASAAVLKQKLRDMRKELEAARKECGDNLAGWQRAKADLVNLRRMTEEDTVRTKERARARILESLVPVLDSFDQARAHDSWNTVDAAWKSGVERIAAQLNDAVTKEGLVRFGVVGEPFNPKEHESMSITAADTADLDDTIAQVLQPGYRIGAEIVRPAKVVVFQYDQ